MVKLRPSLQLRGGTVLKDRTLQDRTISLSNGRFTSGRFPDVDLSGYYILPGIIDLRNDSLAHHLAMAPSPEAALLAADRANAAAGITTSWLTAAWQPLGKHVGQTVLGAYKSQKPRFATKQNLRLNVETLTLADAEALIDAVTDFKLPYVSFTDTLSRRLTEAEADPAAFTFWAKTIGADPALLLDDLRMAASRKREVPRRLCKLAEHFDATGVIYGSSGDRDGETRETYSMLGAKLCDSPGSSTAAAIANAVGDPVILTADMILSHAAPVSARSLIHTGRCAAIGSGNYAQALVPALFRLVEEKVATLPGAWSLVSAMPAQVMRLPDRGLIEPGKKADLTIVNKHTCEVEASFRNGRIVFMCGEAANRFLGQDETLLPAQSYPTETQPLM